MGKELDALENIGDIDLGDNLYKIFEHNKLKNVYSADFNVIKQALLELKSIKKAEPSEALKCLEEELGCPLEVIFKALKDGIYNKRGFHYKVILYEDVLCAYPIDVYDESWKLSNYKNNWWLKEDKSE